MRTADYTEIPKLSRIFRLFERRSRSDCVHKQVAKPGPVSRAAGMDCECPLADKHSPASNARSIKRRVKGGCILFLCHPLPEAQRQHLLLESRVLPRFDRNTAAKSKPQPLYLLFPIGKGRIRSDIPYKDARPLPAMQQTAVVCPIIDQKILIWQAVRKMGC